MKQKKPNRNWHDENPAPKQVQAKYTKPSVVKPPAKRAAELNANGKLGYIGGPPNRPATPTVEMPPKKYILTDETRELCGTTMYRIMAIRAFDEVVVGQLGGFVESEFNLSHGGNCWIAQDAMALNRARVRQDAWLMDNSKILASAEICGSVCIFDNVVLHGRVVILGGVQIYNDTIIGGSIILRGNLRINSNADLMAFIRSQGGKKK